MVVKMTAKFVQFSSGPDHWKTEQIQIFKMQWGSEIQTCPDFEGSTFVQFLNGPDFEMFYLVQIFVLLSN